MRVVRLVLIACLVHAVSAAAEPLELRRGLGTEPWVTWPVESEWTAGARLSPFPEWRQTTTSDDIAAIKAAGFDFVRLALDPAPVLSPGKAMTETAFIAEMLIAIDRFTHQGIKVIAELHTIPRYPDRPTGTEGYFATPEAADAYIAFATAVAAALAREDPQKVAYEPFNEPVMDCPWAQPRTRDWPDHLKRLHASIRKAAPSLTLVLQGGCWGGAEGLVALDPAELADGNIIWSFHSYEPFIVTHQGATWTTGPERFVRGLLFPPSPGQRKAVLGETLKRIGTEVASPTERRELERQLRKDLADYFRPGRAVGKLTEPLDRVAAWARLHGIKSRNIMLGEFGIIRGVEGPGTPEAARARYLSAARKAVEARGFAWVAWGWGGSFGITRSDEDRTFPPQILNALGLKGGGG
jgi:hypothetical protein